MEDDRPIGKITGIEVGHDFEGGIELSESRIHPYQKPGLKGVTFPGIVSNKEGFAVSIVLSGSYADDEDNGDYLIYTGQGGQDNKGIQITDQVIEGNRYNTALVNSFEKSKPIRVIRGYKHKSELSPKKPFFRYAGIFHIKRYWSENSIHGPLIYRFLLEEESFSVPDVMDYDKQAEHSSIIQNVLNNNVDKGQIHYLDITRIAIKDGLLVDYGKTPQRSFNRVLNQNKDGFFKSHGDGYFSLNAPDDKEIRNKDRGSKKSNYNPPQSSSKSEHNELGRSGNKERHLSTEEHNEMERILALFLKERNFELSSWNSPKTDLFWEDENKYYYLAEIKSLRHKDLTKQTSQFRTAIGQIKEYRYRLNALGYPIKKSFLAVTRIPEDDAWFDICEESEIELITYNNYKDKLNKSEE